MAQLRDKNDIKIFILYLLHNINQPMEFTDINDIVVQDGVGYYIISDQGIQISESLSSELLGFIKNKSLKSALRLISFKNGGNHIETSFKSRADGKIDFICRIVSPTDTVLEVKIAAENENQLELMKYNFDDHPEVIYRGVLALLTGELDFLLN